MCHAYVIMMMWKHQRLPHVTHIWFFQVILWTSKNVPGSPYNHVTNHIVTCLDDVAGRMLTW
jgi:hypothetical protein